MKNLCFSLAVFFIYFLNPLGPVLASKIDHCKCLDKIKCNMLVRETGKAYCLIRVGERFLAVRKKKNKKLDLPGGKPKKNEYAQCTAIRETFEETGLHVKVVKLLSKISNKKDLSHYIFQCSQKTGMQGPKSLPVPDSGRNEISEVVWILPNNIKAKKFSRDLELLKKLFLEI